MAQSGSGGIGLIMRFPSNSKEDYDGVMRALSAASPELASNAVPPGSVAHIMLSGKNDPEVVVVDCWESKEAYKQFSPMLMDILKQKGIWPHQVDEMELYNAIGLVNFTPKEYAP